MSSNDLRNETLAHGAMHSLMHASTTEVGAKRTPASRTPSVLTLSLLVPLLSCGPGPTGSQQESVNRPLAASNDVEAASPPDSPASKDESAPESTRELAIHVYPDDDLQAALDRAAQEGIRSVVVHAGTYRPPEPRQALIWFNKRHNGLVVRAEGDVTLTAANEALADRQAASFPAVVNHVVYFGDGVGPTTTLSGFKITGAHH